jgi:pyruvate dehydrogenase E2 component (dihydrolipoamide acetyltransferase)
MATPVIMPRQGQSVESCIIGKWHKSVGDEVKEGDLLFTYETDKATFDEESQVSGTLLAVLYNEDDDVPVLTNVCIIGKEGEDISEFTNSPDKEEAKGDIEEKPEAEEKEEAKKAEVVEEMPVKQEGKLKISPRAKNQAEKSGVNAAFAKGTGPDGRIIERDILELREKGIVSTKAASDAYSEAKVPIAGSAIGGRFSTADIGKTPAKAVESAGENEYIDEKLTNIRKVIANAMQASLSNSAQLTLNASFDATSILAYRAKIKANMEEMGLANITLNDIILFAVSKVLPKHEALNAHFLGDKIRYFKNVNLGVAVDTNRGLMVPKVFNSNLKSLNRIAIEVKELAAKAQEGSLSPDALQGGTFTVTNLGTFGIESFTPVLNPPEIGILGINTIEYKIKKGKDGFIEYPSMALSLTFDHKALDGAPAARFLKELTKTLENFEIALAV